MRAPAISLALLSLGLAACSDASPTAKGICTPFKTADAATSGAPAVASPAADGSAPLEDCLHRWAYSLAGARDSAEIVAEATVAACTSELSKWNQQSLGPTPAGGPPPEAASLLTGEATTPFAEHRNFADSRALFYVVQARAGKCAPPPKPKAAP